MMQLVDIFAMFYTMKLFIFQNINPNDYWHFILNLSFSIYLSLCIVEHMHSVLVFTLSVVQTAD